MSTQRAFDRVAMPPPLFTLLRVAVRAEGAFGVLLHHENESDAKGLPRAVTLERTYPSFKEAGISQQYGDQFVKVPEGRLRCVKRFYNRGQYWTYEIQCAGHTAILFHRGTVELHSEGCVLVAESFQGAGIADGSGLNELLKLAGDRPEFALDVRS